MPTDNDIELIPPTDEPRAVRVIAALNKHNSGLSPENRHAKYENMKKSAFFFYRGTNHLFWEDFAGDNRLFGFGGSRERTWLQGDLHVENFGAFGNDEGVVVYDINDFDEAVIADYQYDVWRMAVSMVLVAQQLGKLSQKQQDEVLDAFALSYLEALADFCQNGGERETIFDIANTSGRLKKLLEKVEEENTRDKMLEKWAPAGRFLVDKNGDKLAKIERTDPLFVEILAGIERYRMDSLARMPEGADDGYFQVRDIAHRLGAGTGSLGTPRYYVLIRGVDDTFETDRILDVKRQSRPIAYQYLPGDELLAYRFFTREMPGQDAIWHAAAYRAMAKDTDDHLGWMELADGFYSVRELSFHKEGIDVDEDLDSKKRFSELAGQWGRVLATAHARALTDFDDDFPQFDLREQLFRPEGGQKAFKCQVTKRTAGKQDTFSQLVKEIAFGYAEQVTADWTTFREAFVGS